MLVILFSFQQRSATNDFDDGDFYRITAVQTTSLLHSFNIKRFWRIKKSYCLTIVKSKEDGDITTLLIEPLELQRMYLIDQVQAMKFTVVVDEDGGYFRNIIFEEY